MADTTKKGLDPKLVDAIMKRIEAIPGITVSYETKGWAKVSGPHGNEGPRIYVAQQKNAVKHVDLSGLGADPTKPIKVTRRDEVFEAPTPWAGCIPLTQPNGRVWAHLDVDAEGALDRLYELASMIPQMGRLERKAPAKKTKAA